jgi:hypothetical protein
VKQRSCQNHRRRPCGPPRTCLSEAMRAPQRATDVMLPARQPNPRRRRKHLTILRPTSTTAAPIATFQGALASKRQAVYRWRRTHRAYNVFQSGLRFQCLRIILVLQPDTQGLPDTALLRGALQLHRPPHAIPVPRGPPKVVGRPNSIKIGLLCKAYLRDQRRSKFDAFGV